MKSASLQFYWYWDLRDGVCRELFPAVRRSNRVYSTGGVRFMSSRSCRRIEDARMVTRICILPAYPCPRCRYLRPSRWKPKRTKAENHVPTRLTNAGADSRALSICSGTGRFAAPELCRAVSPAATAQLSFRHAKYRQPHRRDLPDSNQRPSARAGRSQPSIPALRNGEWRAGCSHICVIHPLASLATTTTHPGPRPPQAPATPVLPQRGCGDLRLAVNNSTPHRLWRVDNQVDDSAVVLAPSWVAASQNCQKGRFTANGLEYNRPDEGKRSSAALGTWITSQNG